MSIEKRKILFILPNSQGGGPVQMLSLLKGINRDKWTCVYAGPNNGGFWSALKENSDRVYDIPFRTHPFRTLLLIIKILWTEKPDLIHAHGKGAGAIGRIANFFYWKPVIYTFHGLYFEHLSPLKQKLYFLSEKLLGFFTFKAISVGKSEYADLKSLHWLSETKIELIPNGIPIPKRNPSDFSDEEIIFGSIVRISPIKGTEKLIEGILKARRSSSRNIKLFVFGSVQSGEEKFFDELNERFHSEIGDWLFFKGHVSPIEIALSQIQVFITNAQKEGLPLTLLEAICSGLPALASRIPAHTEVLKHNPDELFFDFYSEESISKAVQTWINLDNESRANIQKKNQDYVLENYSLSKMVKSTERLYELAAPSR
ncbi:MAG: glycosyltransferase family 4 protein [Bdellovibrionales bacterium]|nr:glycosyltransferase family 4 protein [Bdellovibrionales bacterium]